MGRGESVEGVQIRVLVPVALRRIGDRRRLGRLGNQFGFVPLLLPLDLDCPLKRVREVRSRMLSLRRSVLPPVAMGLMGLVGLAPRAVQEKARGLFARKATGVVTHVPGPQEPVRLAHRRIDRVLFWVPQSGEVGLGVSIITYAGTLQMSLISDAGLVRDPEQVCLHFVQSFNDLLLGLLMGLDNPPNPGV